MQHINCNICNIDDTRFLFEAKDLNCSKRENFNVVQCKKCGLVYLNPQPSEEELRIFYPVDYYINEGSELNLDIQKLWRENSRKLKKILNYKGAGKILDIGCKRADFLAGLRAEGWDVYGLDISEVAAKYAKDKYGIEVIAGDLLDAKLPSSQFDVISILGALEHMRYPLETMREINRILKEDGLLIIYLPNFGSLQAKIFRDKWFHLDVPRHLFQFSAKTIALLLLRAGFAIKSVDHCCFFANYVGLRKSLLYLLRERGEINGLDKKMKQNSRKFSFLKICFNNSCKILAAFESALRRGGTILICAHKI